VIRDPIGFLLVLVIGIADLQFGPDLPAERVIADLLLQPTKWMNGFG